MGAHLYYHLSLIHHCAWQIEDSERQCEPSENAVFDMSCEQRFAWLTCDMWLVLQALPLWNHPRFVSCMPLAPPLAGHACPQTLQPGYAWAHALFNQDVPAPVANLHKPTIHRVHGYDGSRHWSSYNGHQSTAPSSGYWTPIRVWYGIWVTRAPSPSPGMSGLNCSQVQACHG